MTKSTQPKPNRQQPWEEQLQTLAPLPANERVWHNPFSPHHSLRLTVPGKQWLVTRCGLTFYKFDVPEITNHNLLQLDYLLASPYYIRSRKMLYLFGEQDAIMLSLHGNDLAKYLDTLS